MPGVTDSPHTASDNSATTDDAALPPAAPPLPEAVLVTIARQLPLQQRLSSFALVCQTWAAAAAATPADLEADCSSCIRWEHVQDWLHQNADQVSRIRFSHHGNRRQLLQLPCARLMKLQQLLVDSMTVRLLEIPPETNSLTAAKEDEEGDCSTAFSSRCAVSTASRPESAAAAAPAGAAAAPVSLLPQLQNLELFSCSIALEHLLQLSRLTALTALNCYNSTVTQDTSSLAPAAEDALTTTMAAVLQGQHSLSDLRMGLMGSLTLPALQPTSSMQHLQRLQLYVSADAEHSDGFLASLPASLTALEVKDVALVPRQAAVAAQLSRLTGLQELKCEELDLAPELLLRWTSLASLVLDAVYLVPLASHLTESSTISLGPRISMPPAAGGNSNALRALCGSLRQLQQLEHLQLSRMQLDEVTESDLPQLSALTASPMLTSLHLLARFSMPIPRGALQHVLPPGVVRPALQVLRLQGGDGVSAQQCLSAADISRVPSCCPGLTELTLKGVVSVGAGLAPLLKLQGSLRRLGVAGAAFGDGAAALIAQLTGLQSLDWTDSASLSDAGLLRLSALRQLTRLCVKSCKGLSPGVLPPDTWFSASKLLLEEAEAEGRPEVWRQLLQLCEAANTQPADDALAE